MGRHRENGMSQNGGWQRLSLLSIFYNAKIWINLENKDYSLPCSLKKICLETNGRKDYSTIEISILG